MFNSRLVRIGAVAGSCAAIGAGAGLLGSASASSTAATPGSTPHHHGMGARAGGMRALRRAVSVDAIVPAAGGRFVEVTLNRGTVQSISGDQLVISEGTRKATYKTVTLAIPADAVVRDNGRLGQLASIRPGQKVVVFHGPKRTLVRAHDARA